MTEILSCSDQDLKKAADILRSGGVVGIPTETVYGLAANAFDETAVRKIFKAKGRPSDNPLIVHISDTAMIDNIARKIPKEAEKLAEKFWPGPLTMIMPKSDRIPLVTSGGLDTVGIRFPSHPAARKIISLCGLPLAAPSANLSGSPSPTTARRVFEDMDGRIPAIVDGGECSVGVESTVISFENGGVRILRPGGITKEMLEEVVEVTVDRGVTNRLEDSAVAPSPGMKYKHYAPRADVRIIKGSAESFKKYVSENSAPGTFCLLFNPSEAVPGVPYLTYGDTPERQAHELFERLRNLDEQGAEVVFARCPDVSGVGLAVYNRILRAAGFHIIDLE